MEGKNQSRLEESTQQGFVKNPLLEKVEDFYDIEMASFLHNGSAPERKDKIYEMFETGAVYTLKPRNKEKDGECPEQLISQINWISEMRNSSVDFDKNLLSYDSFRNIAEKRHSPDKKGTFSLTPTAVGAFVGGLAGYLTPLMVTSEFSESSNYIGALLGAFGGAKLGAAYNVLFNSGDSEKRKLNKSPENQEFSKLANEAFYLDSR